MKRHSVRELGARTSARIAFYLAIFLAMACGVQMAREPASQAADVRSASQLSTAAKKIRPLHAVKAPSGSDDWLSTHPEPGQTFEQYRRSNPNRPTKEHTTLYILPIGEFSPTQRKLVDETAEFLSRYYNVPTKTLDPLGPEVIPPEAQRTQPNGGDRQFLTTYVLDKVLKPRMPPDAVALLALTATDLWPGEGWNFVFGQASLSDKVGVWSFHRYGNLEGSKAERQQFRRRTFKVALHETGHMFGIAHCTAYECSMNGSNHLDEMDSRPLWLCPECVHKIWWACHANPARRCQSLIEFAKQHGLDTEADFWQKSLDRLRQ